MSGALTGITAAVVGVILNLAVWFAIHVVFRDVGTWEAGPLALAYPVLGSADLGALLLTVLAVLEARLGTSPPPARAVVATVVVALPQPL